MSYTGHIKYSEPLDFLPKEIKVPQVISDRKSGWLVGIPVLNRWVNTGPDRAAADRVLEAFLEIEKKTEERMGKIAK